MTTMYVNMNAWRELLARIFAAFREQDNVSPEWLINPATRRRLKLDKYYQDAGIAVRFIGLLAKGQGRQSDWEVQETEQRDQTRTELCRQNGVQLVLIDPEDEALKQLDGLIRILSRASRTLAQSDRPDREKQQWMPALSAARDIANDLRSRIARNPEQMMTNLSDSWRDREASFSAAGDVEPLPLPMPNQAATPGSYFAGQRVRHERFGPGVVIETANSGAELTVTILFNAEQQRTFLAALVQDKLTAE